MGKIIVNNIKGMGWKAKAGLVIMFTLIFSVLIYQGWRQSQDAHAAVAVGTSWSNIHAAAPNTTLPAATQVSTTSTGSYTAGAGTSRLLLVAVYYELATASTATFSTTFGSATVTQIATSGGSSNREHVWLGYVKDASIPTVASTVQSRITCATASTLSSISIKVATYTGVDQTTPIVGSNANLSAGTSVASNASVSYVVGGMTVVAHANGGAPATPTYTATPALTTTTSASNTTNHSTYIASSAEHTAAGSYASGGISISYSGTTSVRSVLAVASLRPAAITTLANGTAGSSINVAPGAANQKIDGFTFAANSGTDTVTGLTVTTTNQAAIASMSIWNEAGTTQYFTTVNNPGLDTWNFSGGTSIPVTTTTANYKVLVTYKARATAPAGDTATTANVTSFTSTNAKTGTDAVDTTLTLLNTHAASTWGTNTPGNAQIVLNWTKGTSTQSAIIIRYTANTDTTKPTDGTSYTIGSAFGAGGTVIYNGSASTYTNTGLTNGTTYYYKIFEYDAVNYYYNVTDVWTAALTPVSPDAVAPTVDAGFSATTPINTLVVPITSFGATDNVGGSGVAGYMITTSSTKPLSADAGWTSTPPATYTVAAAGTYTLYPWAKDGGGNVSSVYGAPVTVGVDLTKPTVSAFTLTATQVATRNIPVGSFTASDTGVSGMAGYMITTTATPPAATDPSWSGTAPTIFPVALDGSYTLYPWAKDAAGNVSALFGTPRTVFVDTIAPPVPAIVSPPDMATGQPQATVLSCSTVTDSGVGGVMYQFEITDQATYTQNSGWIAGTSYAPPNLVKGELYLWKVKAKDALGNESQWTAQATFVVTAPCVRNDPTMTLLTPAGGIASTITTDSGSSVYNLRLINNDSGDCGSTTFNLSIADTDLYNVFNDSVFVNGLATSSIALLPGAETTATVTAKATPGENSGVEKTTVTAAGDVNHAAVTTSFVQTTLNVVTCQPQIPLLIVGPDSGYLNKGGKIVYTITVKNTDTGAGCSPVVYTLSKGTESNTTDFNVSQFSTTTLTLGSGELGSATLTVSAKSTAAKNAVNLTPIHLAAAGHTSPADVTVKSTVNNPMLHNSSNVNSTKWSVSGGWGIPNGRYGEIECATCHVGGGGDTLNVKRINEKVFTPYTTTHIHFPGEGKTIAYRRYIGAKATDPVLGWDAGATPRTNPNPTKICEACHTYDATGANGVKAHPYSTTATLGNHFNTDGKDCTKCHKHNNGFGASNMLCNSCHGDTSAATINAANRYVVAPPVTTTGATGTITGTGLVSNDPKVGAHQTHLRMLNGFSNYSTVDYRCQSCHGPVPTDFAHANGSSPMVFGDTVNSKSLANRWGARTGASFSSVNLTCSNTYCHNPAGTGGTIGAANAGTAVFPTWTSARYLNDTAGKNATNCNKCHKSPNGTAFAATNYDHGNMPLSDDCAGCHGHNGDTTGDAGKRHMDGVLYGAGNCNSCHGYEASSWAAAPNIDTVYSQGKGAHAKHIAYLVSRFGVTLNPTGDKFGTDTLGSNGSWTKVCQVCHAAATHMGGTNRQISFNSIVLQHGTAAMIYNGVGGTSSAVNPKTCSNLSCHYMQTPVWSTY